MKKSSIVLLLTLFAYFSCAQCHEILDDFLNFNVQSSESQLAKECSDHLGLIKKGIKSKEVWALKGEDRRVRKNEESSHRNLKTFSSGCQW